MPLDVFTLRESVVLEYQEYVTSFVRVLDPRTGDYMNDRLDQGGLWPEAVLKFNPAFEMDETLGELAAKGIITSWTAQFFGEDLCFMDRLLALLRWGCSGVGKLSYYLLDVGPAQTGMCRKAGCHLTSGSSWPRADGDVPVFSERGWWQMLLAPRGWGCSWFWARREAWIGGCPDWVGVFRSYGLCSGLLLLLPRVDGDVPDFLFYAPYSQGVALAARGCS